MRRLGSALVILVMATIVRPASAHFLWLQAEPAEQSTRVHLWFSETTVPGEAKLLDRIAKSQAWIRQADGATKLLTLEKQITGDTGGWTTNIDGATPACLEATCDYGVVSRGGETFLLQYHARHLQNVDALPASAATHSKPLPLNVAASAAGKALTIAVQFDGKPAADAQLVAVFPDNRERELKLDSSGAVHVADAQPGDYAIRARLDRKTSGDRDDKHYDLGRHYTTLTFKVPDSKSTTAGASSATATTAAAELLQKARDERAVWEKFPGFTAQITVAIDGRKEQGTVAVDDAGSAAVKLTDEKLRSWAEAQAGSLVQHRLPSGFGDEKPTFADDVSDHPLGRLVRLGDSGFASVYRIRDGVVTEVNRHAGPARFTITVLETERNQEGKYLPRSFSITTWDEKTSQIKSSSSFLNTWTRVGNFDLPSRILEVQTTPGDRSVRELTFANYRLSGMGK